MSGEAWLSARWLEPITTASELRTQVRKGRVAARRGWVEGLTVRPGLVTSDVRSDMGGTNTVRIRMPVIEDAVWEDVLDTLAAEAGYGAMLLGGRLTEEIARVFEDVGVELFPFALRDVANFCSCREDAGPLCTHSVATHFALADAMINDPFVLFEFRGRTKDRVLDELRARRPSAVSYGEETASADEDEHLEPAVALAEGYWERGIVPHLAFRFGNTQLEGEESLPVIRALGPGPGEVPPEEVADVLAPLARVGTDRMRNIIEHVEEADEERPVAPDPTEARTLDDLLVAAAHQHGSLTTGLVPEALAVNPNEARRYLRWLVQEGRMVQVGRGRGTRYVLPDAPEAGEAGEEEDE